VIVGHKLWILVENKVSGLTAFVEFAQFKTLPSLRCAQMPYMEQYPSAGTTLKESNAAKLASTVPSKNERQGLHEYRIVPH
jgi:hypothetical protein